MRGPALVKLAVADEAASWRSLGFEAEPITVGSVIIEMTATSDPAAARGIVSWTFRATPGAQMPSNIDGITTHWLTDTDLQANTESLTDTGSLAKQAPEEQAASLLDDVSLDHVVMITPDLERSVAALEAAGFPARRERTVPEPAGIPSKRRQIFFWAGDSIIELVGPVEPEGDGPALLWGIAVTSTDIDSLASTLGERMGRVKDAVQAGRRIGTLRTKECGVSTAIAVMTPHQKP